MPIDPNHELRDRVERCELRLRAVKRHVAHILEYQDQIKGLAQERDKDMTSMTVTAALIDQSVKEIRNILGSNGRGTIPERVSANELLIKALDNKVDNDIKSRSGWSVMWVSIVASTVMSGIMTLFLYLVTGKK